MQNKLFSLYAGLLALVFGGVLMHAPLSVWLGMLFPEQELLIKSWKEIILFFLFLIGLWLVVRHKLHQELRRDKLFLLITGYAGLHLLLLPIFQPPPAALLAGLAIDLRYLLFFVLVYIAVRWSLAWRQRFLWVAFGVSTLSLGFAVLQIFVLPKDILAYIGYSKATIAPYLTVDNNPDYIRINGTFRGPNPLGAFGVMVMSLLAAAGIKARQFFASTTRRTWFMVTLVASVCIIYASYARSALVAAVVALGSLLLLSLPRKTAFRALAVMAGTLAVLALGIFAARETSFVQHVILHEDPEGKSPISSNEGHIESLADGLRRMIQQPLGAGPGSTGSASLFTDEPVIIENHYLFVAHESGWLGVGLFLMIFGMVIWRLYRQRHDWLALGLCASGVGLAVIGIFLPVWADDTISLLWWGLAAIALASAKGGEYGQESTNQKAA
ncbi:MAG TPA: O-antigen ligase family protein [Verrucomicrobiae bacterium]|nr:O-antigen ligase family protein [Verrucomicrobiae bacterium]